MKALSFYATGEPAPKGSLRHVGHGRLVEQVKKSRPWRDAVTIAAAAARDQEAWATLDGPVTVIVHIAVARPKTVRRLWPITRSSGDVDKHARNVLDAITDAHLIRDDSQVIDLRITKAYATEPHRVGALITVRAYPEEVAP